MMKHELYAIRTTRLSVSPLDGVYIISTVPRRKAPPTYVALGQITTQEFVHNLENHWSCDHCQITIKPCAACLP